MEQLAEADDWVRFSACAAVYGALNIGASLGTSLGIVIAHRISTQAAIATSMLGAVAALGVVLTVTTVSPEQNRPRRSPERAGLAGVIALALFAFPAAGIGVVINSQLAGDPPAWFLNVSSLAVLGAVVFTPCVLWLLNRVRLAPRALVLSALGAVVLAFAALLPATGAPMLATVVLEGVAEPLLYGGVFAFVSSVGSPRTAALLAGSALWVSGSGGLQLPEHPSAGLMGGTAAVCLVAGVLLAAMSGWLGRLASPRARAL